MTDRTSSAGRESGITVTGGHPDDCPHINFAPVEPGERGDGGGRMMRLEATVALPSEGTVVARLRDARTGEVLGTESADAGSLTLRDGREWAEGEHTVEVEVLSPEGCPRVSSTFRVETHDGEPRDRDRENREDREDREDRGDRGDRDAPRSYDRERDDDGRRDRGGASGSPPACPRIRFERPEFGDSDEDGRRRVRLCARVELPEERRVVARLRDCDSDRVLATESSDSGRLKLRGRCAYDEGEHSVAVEILSPEQCPEVATTFRVPSAEDDDDERLRRIKQGRRHREDEDREEQERRDDGDEDDDDRSRWAGMAWGIAVAGYLVILAVESGFLASAIAFGIASAVMAMTAGVALLSSGPARWAGWTYLGVALAVVVGILLLALTNMVSVGGVLLAAGIAAAGFAIGAAIASVYGKRREQSRQDEDRGQSRDDRYRNRETEP